MQADSYRESTEGWQALAMSVVSVLRNLAEKTFPFTVYKSGIWTNVHPAEVSISKTISS